VGEGGSPTIRWTTFGGAGVVRDSQFAKLLRYICERGFEHHVAANLAPVSAAVREAATRYLGWSVHHQ
jgi:L-fucose isomerase-like protein